MKIETTTKVLGAAAAPPPPVIEYINRISQIYFTTFHMKQINRIHTE